MNSKISCIVPVYNEGKRVGGVLNALVGHPMVDEVIVVNDGSSDDSEAVLKKIKGIRLISYKKNRGKTLAMKMGFEAAKNNLVMTIDSDLVGLDRGAIGDLIEPVLKDRADVSISLRKNSLGLFKLLGLDFVSGERVFDKKLLGDFGKLKKLPGFGLEVYMNNLIIQKKSRIKVVKWKNVISPRKSVKFGWFAGAWGDTKMVMQIVKVLGVFGVFRQFWKMRKLKV